MAEFAVAEEPQAAIEESTNDLVQENLLVIRNPSGAVRGDQSRAQNILQNILLKEVSPAGKAVLDALENSKEEKVVAPNDQQQSRGGPPCKGPACGTKRGL